jgi:hypothetical protein
VSNPGGEQKAIQTRFFPFWFQSRPEGLNVSMTSGYSVIHTRDIGSYSSTVRSSSSSFFSLQRFAFATLAFYFVGLMYRAVVSRDAELTTFGFTESMARIYRIENRFVSLRSSFSAQVRSSKVRLDSFSIGSDCRNELIDYPSVDREYHHHPVARTATLESAKILAPLPLPARVDEFEAFRLLSVD